jgi:hypothetical protein
MESVQVFITKMKEQRHVLELIKNIDYLTIRLVAEDSSISFAIANNDVFVLQNAEEEIPLCEIQGGIKNVEDLLKGKEKLRTLVNHGRLQISAPFRTVLMLESLFYLAKSEIPTIKII